MIGRLRIALALVLCACTPSAEKVDAWIAADDDRAVERLSDAVKNDRAPAAIRARAAIGLVTITRRGRHVGIPILADALEETSPTSRAKVTSALAPTLVLGMAGARTAEADPSLPFKDATRLLLARKLVDVADRDALADAIARWARDAPVERLRDPTQRYGLRTTIEAAGLVAVRAIVPRLAEPPLRSEIATIVGEIGDDATKRASVDELVRDAATIATPAWREANRADIEALEAQHGLQPPREQADVMLGLVQRRVLEDVCDAIRRVGGRAAIDELAREAAEATSSTRDCAIRGLSAHLDEIGSERVAAIVAGVLEVPPSETGIVEVLMAHPAARARLVAAARTAPRSVRYGIVHRSFETGAFDEGWAALGGEDATFDLRVAFGLGRTVGDSEKGRTFARAHLTDASVFSRIVAIVALRGDADVLAAAKNDTTPLPACAALEPKQCPTMCSNARVGTIAEAAARCFDDATYVARASDELASWRKSR
ncbi:MAG TPA: hypothetical protein VIF62_01895 [Labilithrix sp.]|jgi:hypothetical protein